MEIPQGAIWVKNYKLRKTIANFVGTRDLECPKCHSHFQDDLSESEEQDLNETVINHVMTVKLKSVREKFIAIYNPKKSLSTHPDYFLYVYQAYTGAPAVYPFSNTSSAPTDRVDVTGKGQAESRISTDNTTGTYQSTPDSSS